MYDSRSESKYICPHISGMCIFGADTGKKFPEVKDKIKMNETKKR